MNLLLIAAVFTARFNDKPLAVFAGPDYGNYKLYQDSVAAGARWQFGGEIGFENLLPNVGIRVHGAYLQFEVPVTGLGRCVYDYIPVSFGTEFNLLPFLRSRNVALYLLTGAGWYYWRGTYNGAVIILPSGGRVEENDLGFIGGLSFRIRLLKNLGVEAASRYHYLASANIAKYGYFDKDDKLWENGIGCKFFFP